jgi:osmotically-inducible protein OsmY
LAARVLAVLALSSDISQSNFEIKAQAGKVAVKGVLPTWLSEELVVAKIRQMPGVEKVETDFISAPDIIYGD